MSLRDKFRWKKKEKKKQVESKPQITNNSPQGPMTPYFQDQYLRKVSGEFYEILREGIPFIDSAIQRLISLNGTIKIVGDNMKIVQALEDFCLNVPVNDMQKGIQSFLENTGNEVFEQGFCMAEFVATKDMKDIAGLKVADSKNIVFRRNAAGVSEPWYRYPGATPQRTYSMPGSIIQQILTASYGQSIFVHGMWEVKLDLANKMYFSIGNENSNPYGTSKMRSLEFVSQILVTIENSMKNVFERQGDPSFHVHYEAQTNSADDLTARKNQLKNDFNTVMNAKRKGASADLITAGGPDSKVTIGVIGGDGKIVAFNEVPLKHVIQGIVGRFGIPAWMIGIYWSTTERTAVLEIETVLQDAKVRQIAMLPEFIRLFSTYLTLRGFKWNTIGTTVEKPGDWGIVFETPNLRDMMTEANARFLNAQADMMESGAMIPGHTPESKSTVEINGITLPLIGIKTAGAVKHKADCTGGRCKEVYRPTEWPSLDTVEHEYEKVLKYDWSEFESTALNVLGLDDAKSAKGDSAGETFTFSDQQRESIFKSLDEFTGEYELSNADSAVKYYYGQAYSLGLIQAAHLIGKEQPLLSLLKNKEIFEQIAGNGFTLVKDRATLAVKDRLIPFLEAHVSKGSNPREVAAAIKKLEIFKKANKDWERLARSEMSMAAESAKLQEWAEWKVQMVEFTPAPDACPICMDKKGDYEISKCPLPVRDTHPRCRCSTRPAESET